MLPPGSKRSKIRPPRKLLVSSSLDNGSDLVVDYDKSWQVLSNAISQIQSKNVSNLLYEQLYRKAYILVLRKFGARLYDNVAALVASHLLTRRDYLMSITSGNEDFMKAILLEWNEHLQAMKFVSDVLMYLNRVYVKEHKKLLIYDLGIQLFKDSIIKYNNNEVGQRIIEIVIEDISRARRGEAITTNMYITKIINMLELMVETGGLEIQYGENYYQQVFEPAFLLNSETFFYKLAQDFVNYGLGTRFLHETSQFIKDEQYRINLFCLPSSTYPKLIDLMNNIIIKDKIDGIMLLPQESQGFSYWLQSVTRNIFEDKNEPHNIKELSILRELIGRIDPEEKLLRLRLKETIIAQGNTIPNFVRRTLEASGAKKSATNSPGFANKWVDTILAYYDQMKAIINDAFDRDPLIEQTVTFAIRDFINTIPSKKDPNSVNAPELLSVYMDHHIKLFSKNSPKEFSSSSSDPSGELIAKSTIFLGFIKDKDSFEANYANHFAKRFLTSKSGSSQLNNSNNKLGVDLEELIISKLGEEMGTSSLEKVIKMNRDIKLSRDITTEWKKYLNEGPKRDELVNLELKICNVTDWPKSMTKDYKAFSNSLDSETQFIWSRQLRHTISVFEEFWFAGKKNHNKSLFWSPKFGSMDFRISYPSRTYEINMSTYAGLIMLLFSPQSTDADGYQVLAFDEKREYTYDEIKELTGIPEQDLKRHLQSIAVAPRLRLLIKVPMSKDVNNTDTFKLNDKFKSPSVKVKVLTVSASSSGGSSKGKPKTEQEEEAEEVNSNIVEGRKMEVNAAIVRIMKARQSIRHNELIEEIIKQLTNRFQPLILLIKQRVEDLIEKEYIKRDDEVKNLYHYVA